MEQLDPKYFNAYFKFAIVRNPMSWLVSYYHFITQKPNNHPQLGIIKKLGFFESFIDWAAENEMERHSQKKFIYQGDKKLVEFVGRYERLEEDLQKVKSILGLPEFEMLHLNKSDHDAYNDYYTPRMEAIVRERLSEDFELFNY